MTKSQTVRSAQSQPAPLVLSLFPGIDLLGRGFEAEGYCIVRGPDPIFAGDIRTFHPPAGRFNGIIAGPPCPDFSAKRRTAPTGEGIALLRECARVIHEAQPDWWLIENVPRVPDVAIPGYTVQRFDLNARECGLTQRRHRHFQFGSRTGLVLVPDRQPPPPAPAQPTALASEGNHPKWRRTWADFCELQGLPRTFTIPGQTLAARYQAVGNGVPIPMARAIARAILVAHHHRADVRLCACNCGRIVTGRQISATPACRKRLQRQRDNHLAAPARAVTPPGVTNTPTPALGNSHPTVTTEPAAAIAESHPSVTKPNSRRPGPSQIAVTNWPTLVDVHTQ